MSAVDTTCYPVAPEIVSESGAGEMKCLKSVNYSGSSFSNLIASEIVNDILENALDIVFTKKSEPPVEKISNNVVGDILDNILSTSINPDDPNRVDETILLDDEIKRIIKEMKYPPEPPKNPICTKGIGDQLEGKKEIPSEQILSEPTSKRNTLERKNRLTNLVRNSKHILCKFITNEDETRLKASKSEETHEKLLKIIDLESKPQNTKVEVDQGNSKTAPGMLQFPSDTVLDVIDLDCGTHDTRKAGSLRGKGKTASPRKRNWSLGAKILRYFKRHPKKETAVVTPPAPPEN